jgi:hypothetical protein
MRRRASSRAAAAALSGTLIAFGGVRSARGDEKTPAAAAPSQPAGPRPPEEISGIERPARESGEPARALANALLWVPRSVADLVFLTTGTAAGLVENEQVVPRAHDFFFSQQAGGEVGIFPTAFIETSTPLFNVGARFVAYVGPLATTMRAGYGGPDSNLVESRLRFTTSTIFPAVFSLEGYHDRRSGLSYLGLGQTPQSDPRNVFLGEPRAGIYRERRERIIAGLGIRPFSDVEVLASSSITQRFTDDAPESAPDELDQVLAPPSVPGFGRTQRIAYQELAVRYDSRSSREAVVTGNFFELYSGWASGLGATHASFFRAGGRIAGFFPVFRSSSVLSPRIVIDALEEVGAEPVPFTELVGQPTFRGFDNRRDHASLVASLDYRWPIVRYLAARLFFDAARVDPSLSELHFKGFRYAGGFGFELHSRNAELGRVALALSSDGFSFLFSFGGPGAGFGDRQHRD